MQIPQLRVDCGRGRGRGRGVDSQDVERWPTLYCY